MKQWANIFSVGPPFYTLMKPKKPASLIVDVSHD